MNIKIIIIIIFTIILILSVSLFFYFKHQNKVWRRRFPEFPVRIFEMACGTTYTEIENKKTNDKRIIKINDWFNSDFIDYTSEITLINNHEPPHHDVQKFINSWINGVIGTLPREVANKINNTNSYYKLLMFSSSIIANYTCNEMYILSLNGTQTYNINDKKYIANKGDIIYIPKNTYYTITPFNKSNIILTVN